MKSRSETAIELGCAYATVERYAHELDLKPAMIVDRYHYYSRPQIKKMEAHQRAKKETYGHRGGKQKKQATCKRADCRYRSDCLLTDKIYTQDCPDYKPEFEAGDFYGRVAMDQYDRFVEKG